MQGVSRPYAMAVAALAATSLVAVTPLASEAANEVARAPMRSIATKLVDFDLAGLANIPLNLFYDLVNIPANEIYATQFFTDNLFMAGPWFVVGPTNLWGVDPGDPTHFMSVTNFLFPFTDISGMNSSELDFSAGLGQQIWGLVASELPTNASCDEFACMPFELASPVTGISGADFFVWLNSILSGQTSFGLFDNWFNADYNPDGSFHFDPTAPGSIEPVNDTTTGNVSGFLGWSQFGTSGQLDGSGGLLGGEGIPGTVTGADGAQLMPWAGSDYQFEPWQPFINFFNHLTDAPSTDGLFGTGIDPIYGDFTEITQTFQSFLAGLMMFDPITPGSPFCPGDCSFIVDNHLDYPDLIKDINSWTPGGNPVINEWLEAYANGAAGGPAGDTGANVPTMAGILRSIELLQNHDYWDFDHPGYPDMNTPGNPDLADLAPQFEQFWTSLGFNVHDNTPALEQFTNLFSPEALQDSWAALAAGFSPEQLAADWAALGAAFDPTQITADFTALLASIGL
ncbi:hypothetical protein PT015_10765 [Candidatus Mycobacterium wuenschmannii]|uniref:PE-PGRS family protein n=1 Tax=Candidatus Mycobacterium wuenschmannii TaxID=3027808 RepID=A0ABY8W608_9MYCO|nr:hypothetical protein [Candidatus Mycobacterium wuenschmannii]WIM89858.1 hypothetical protein PT015_10765 [Candidatus Mycobacterium wuenschmannii]